jgi:hypothetical protein
MFKVLGIQCYHTGTEDHGEYDPDNEKCQRCTYKYMCQSEANLDTKDLDEARNIWLEACKMEEEALMLKETAKRTFNKIMQEQDLIKYQISNLVVSSVLVKESKQYPKAKLLKVFSEEQLEPASEIKPSYTYLKINDLLKDKKKND